MSSVVVVVGGAELSPRALAAVPDGATVVAADSGLDHAVAAGLRPALLVGDLDSISAAGRMWAYAHELEIDEFPTDKDATDTELAIAAALKVQGITDLLVAGGVGERLDHLLGMLLTLGHPSLGSLSSVSAVIGDTEFVIVHPGRTVQLGDEPGRLFSVLALHGACSGVTIRDARWELDGATIASTESRGISNETREHTMISVTSGVLTVVVP